MKDGVGWYGQDARVAKTADLKVGPTGRLAGGRSGAPRAARLTHFRHKRTWRRTAWGCYGQDPRVAKTADLKVGPTGRLVAKDGVGLSGARAPRVARRPT